MTYQNDPDRPRAGDGRRTAGSMSWLPIAIGAAVVVALILMFMPTRDTTGPRTTQTAPSATTKPVTTPASPPANTPGPSTPTQAPQK